MFVIEEYIPYEIHLLFLNFFSSGYFSYILDKLKRGLNNGLLS